jgi:hypothetical protein
MPKTSNRQKLIKQFQKVIFLAAITDDHELAEEFLENQALLQSTR